MIKISELLVRKKDMSLGEFHDYWKRVHGPLVMSIPEIRRHVVKYVQSQTQPDWFSFLVGDGPLFDGIAEVWCESIADAQLMFEEPKFAEVVTPDEKQFLDMSGTVILLMSQHLIYQRRAAPIHGGVKLFELAARRREMTRSECHRHWRDIHAPLVLRSDEMIKPLRRYCNRIPSRTAPVVCRRCAMTAWPNFGSTTSTTSRRASGGNIWKPFTRTSRASSILPRAAPWSPKSTLSTNARERLGIRTSAYVEVRDHRVRESAAIDMTARGSPLPKHLAEKVLHRQP